MKKIKLTTAILCVLIVLLFNMTSNAYIADKKWSNNSNVTWYANNDIANDCIDAIGDAAYTWGMTYPYSVGFYYGGTDCFQNGYREDDINAITAYEFSGYMYYWLAGCMVYRDYGYSPPLAYEFDIDINTNVMYPWTTTGDDDCFDVQNAMTHEMGHAIFSADITNSSQVQSQYVNEANQVTMWGYMGTEETLKRSPHQDDIDGYASVY